MARDDNESVEIVRDRGTLDAAAFWKKTSRGHPAWGWAGVVTIAVLSLVAAFAIGFGLIYAYHVMR